MKNCYMETLHQTVDATSWGVMQKIWCKKPLCWKYFPRKQEPLTYISYLVKYKTFLLPVLLPVKWGAFYHINLNTAFLLDSIFSTRCVVVGISSHSLLAKGLYFIVADASNRWLVCRFETFASSTSDTKPANFFIWMSE